MVDFTELPCQQLPARPAPDNTKRNWRNSHLCKITRALIALLPDDAGFTFALPGLLFAVEPKRTGAVASARQARALLGTVVVITLQKIKIISKMKMYKMY